MTAEQQSEAVAAEKILDQAESPEVQQVKKRSADEILRMKGDPDRDGAWVEKLNVELCCELPDGLVSLSREIGLSPGYSVADALRAACRDAAFFLPWVTSGQLVDRERVPHGLIGGWQDDSGDMNDDLDRMILENSKIDEVTASVGVGDDGRGTELDVVVPDDCRTYRFEQS